MKKLYIKPFIEIDDLEVDCVFLAGSPTPPASGVDNFIDETPTGLDPSVTGGDYGPKTEDEYPFIEGD